jgi:hypothetical protein
MEDTTDAQFMTLLGELAATFMQEVGLEVLTPLPGELIKSPEYRNCLKRSTEKE